MKITNENRQINIIARLKAVLAKEEDEVRDDASRHDRTTGSTRAASTSAKRRKRPAA
jgi:[protein-PII] uridylyltransferase